MSLCGGVCTVSFLDGMLMQISANDYDGVISYKILTRPKGQIAISPRIMLIKDILGKTMREAQMYWREANIHD